MIDVREAIARRSSVSLSEARRARLASSSGASSTPRSEAVRRIDAIRAWPYCT